MSKGNKPNQSIQPAILQPIPAFYEPVRNLVIDCVGSLPNKEKK